MNSSRQRRPAVIACGVARLPHVAADPWLRTTVKSTLASVKKSGRQEEDDAATRMDLKIKTMETQPRPEGPLNKEAG